MKRNLVILMLSIVGIILCSSPRPADASEELVEGSKLIIKNKGGKAKFLWISKDPAIFNHISAGATLGDAALTVVSGDGDIAAVSLRNWTANSDGSIAKYKNKLAPGGDSVCRVAMIKNTVPFESTGMVKINCPADLIDVLDPGPEGSIEIKFETEFDRICARFEGIKTDEPGVFIAKGAPRPGACTQAILPLPPKHVFIGSIPLSGNLSGISGADSYCSQRALAAGLSGSFKAWLGDHASDPRTSFSKYLGPYALVDDTIIANNWFDLVDDTPLHADIRLDEFGATAGNQYVWSGTDAHGARTGINCIDWLSSNPIEHANVTYTADGVLGSTSTTSSCDAANAIFCFQQ